MSKMILPNSSDKDGVVSLCETCHNTECRDWSYHIALKQSVVTCPKWIHDLDKEDSPDDSQVG